MDTHHVIAGFLVSMFALAAAGHAQATGADASRSWPPPILPAQRVDPLQQLLQGSAGGAPRQGLQGPRRNFPLASSGFGGFPILSPLVGDAAVPPPLGLNPPRDPNAWPSWIAVDDSVRAEEGFLPDRAILSRSAERVWYLAPDAPAFVPLSFHEKIRLITAGSRIEVRGRGEFQILFHGGATLRSRGPIELGITQLEPDRILLDIGEYRHVWIRGQSIPIDVRLASKEVLTASGSPMYLEREGDLGLLRHSGGGVLSVESPVGSIEVPAAHRVELLTGVRNVAVVPAALGVAGDATSIQDGRILRAEGGANGGTVVWNGAKFAVDAGSTLRVDPLAGVRFPENRLP